MSEGVFYMDERSFYNYNLFMKVFAVEEYAKQLYVAFSGADVNSLQDFNVKILCNAIYITCANCKDLLIHNNMTLYQSKCKCFNNEQQYMSEYISVNCKDYSFLKEKGSSLDRVMFCNDESLNIESMILGNGDIQIINVSAGKSEVLKRKCGILYELTIFVSTLRRMCESMKIEKAVCKSVNCCINNGILKDFLLKNKDEIKQMCIFEYLKEKQTDIMIMESTRLAYNEGFRTGLIKGKKIGENKKS